jgi:hypothetical protein
VSANVKKKIKDTYNTISHSSIVSSKQIKNKNGNKNDSDDDNDDMLGTMNGAKSSFVYGNSSNIPVALVIGISVCILSLLVLLFVTVIYCIRKRNFKLCKALLSAPSNFSASNNNNAGMVSHGSIGNLAKQIQMESGGAEKLKTL